MSKKNHGGLASDERATLRQLKYRPTYGCPAMGPSYLGQSGVEPPRDLLAERAAWRARNRSGAVLGLGSPFRAATTWRLLRRFPNLYTDCSHGYPRRECPHACRK